MNHNRISASSFRAVSQTISSIVASLLLWNGFAVADELFDPTYRYIVPAERVSTFISKPICAPIPENLVKRISSAWTPQESEVSNLERSLPSALRDTIEKTDWIGPKSRSVLTQWTSIGKHARQYAGIVVNGRKVILVVAAPTYYIDFDGRQDMQQFKDVHWRDHLIGACDGGPDQFTALYDVESKKFAEFRFSGTFAGFNVP